MKIALIGGSGLIGRALTHELVENEHEITILTRRPVTASRVGNIQWRQWDGKDPAELSQLIDGQEGIINLAGESIGKGHWTEKRKAQLLQSRLEPTRAIVTALKSCSLAPSLLVQASAVGYYGSGDLIYDESAPCGGDFLAGLALKWENASKPVEALGLRRVILRTGVVLSRAGGVLTQLTLPFKLFAGGPLGTGRQWISWIHIKDEVRAIRFLLESAKASGAYNLTAPEAVTNAEMGKMLAKYLRRPDWLPLPAFALRIALGEMSTLVVDGQKVVPTRLIEAGFTFQYPTLELAMSNLLS